MLKRILCVGLVIFMITVSAIGSELPDPIDEVGAEILNPDGTLTYKVFGSEFATFIGDTKPDSGVFLIVYCAIYNHEKKGEGDPRGAMVSGWHWCVADSNGQEYMCSTKGASAIRKLYKSQVDSYNDIIKDLNRLGVGDSDILRHTGGRYPYVANSERPAWSDCNWDNPFQVEFLTHALLPSGALPRTWTRCIVVYEVSTESSVYVWRYGLSKSFIKRYSDSDEEYEESLERWRSSGVPDVVLHPDKSVVKELRELLEIE